MSVTLDIARTYRAPREVLRRRLSGGQREDRALAIVMAACVLIFIAQWPRLSREAYLNPEIELNALMAGALLGWVFFAPLALYGIAAVSHVLARLVGGKGTWHGARMALFWALLAAAPMWLLSGLVAGFVGPGPALSITGFAALAAFLVFWGAGLMEVEQ